MHYYEIDFLKVESNKSGDAIAIRYKIDNEIYVHIVDAGYQQNGPYMVDFVKSRYGVQYIDHVVATHPDGDHVGGLRSVLEELDVGALWMWRPWLYSEYLVERFKRWQSADNLAKRLRELYPNIAALEEIAIRRGIPIYEPEQGAQIGPFVVTSPTREHFLKCVEESERTPEVYAKQELERLESSDLIPEGLKRFAVEALNFLKALWGQEVFSDQPTSAENEMSVVQYSTMCGDSVMLTADAGREALDISIKYLKNLGVGLPGIDRFQIPHHGSRRNVSTDILDQLLGKRLDEQLDEDELPHQSFVSSAKEDPHHPRRSVVRAMIHRGYKVYPTEGNNVHSHSSEAPSRPDYSPMKPARYPTDMEL